jgi:phage baseplate assembly protein gpV
MVLKEHVVCLADEHCEDGVILGAIYNDDDPIDPAAADDKFRMLFEDGTYFEYDKTTHQMTVSLNSSDGKLLLQKGTDTLKQALTLIVEAVQPIVVLYGNNPVYTKLTQALTKINNLLA